MRTGVFPRGVTHPRESLADLFDGGRAEKQRQRAGPLFTALDLADLIDQGPIVLQPGIVVCIKDAIAVMRRGVSSPVSAPPCFSPSRLQCQERRRDSWSGSNRLVPVVTAR